MCIVTNDFACIFSNVHFTRHEVGMNEQMNFEVEKISRAKNLFSNEFAKSKTEDLELCSQMVFTTESSLIKGGFT